MQKEPHSHLAFIYPIEGDLVCGLILFIWDNQQLFI